MIAEQATENAALNATIAERNATIAYQAAENAALRAKDAEREAEVAVSIANLRSQ